MFILDTNVVSELRKARHGKADKAVTAWANSIRHELLFLSAITIFELEMGILLAQRRDPPQAAIFRLWLTDYVLPAFAGRILEIDAAVAQCSAALHVPDPRSYRDAFIAGTAIAHGMSVVTRNTGDFASAGVRLINPWSFDGSL